MKPVNNKSLLHFIYDQMDKLENKEITVLEAKAQAALSKQANNAMMYEIERTRMLISLAEHNQNSKGEKIEFRNIEGKIFDNIE